MCTYWENAVKEFYKKQENERNKRAASKSQLPGWFSKGELGESNLMGCLQY
ncbi:hypothetical protein [Bacillus cereus]|uniref:hypothetical protein n=1 Tax=Bacillus cereus TaxID=1396 RepID=UPI001F09FEB4